MRPTTTIVFAALARATSLPARNLAQAAIVMRLTVGALVMMIWANALAADSLPSEAITPSIFNGWYRAIEGMNEHVNGTFTCTQEMGLYFFSNENAIRIYDSNAREIYNLPNINGEALSWEYIWSDGTAYGRQTTRFDSKSQIEHLVRVNPFGLRTLTTTLTLEGDYLTIKRTNSLFLIERTEERTCLLKRIPPGEYDI